MTFLEVFLNAAVHWVDMPSKSKGSSRYISENQLMTIFIKKDESRLRIAKRRTTSEVWVKLIAATMDLNTT